MIKDTPLFNDILGDDKLGQLVLCKSNLVLDRCQMYLCFSARSDGLVGSIIAVCAEDRRFDPLVRHRNSFLNSLVFCYK